MDKETIINFRGDFPYAKIIAVYSGELINRQNHLKIAGCLGAQRMFKKPVAQVNNRAQRARLWVTARGRKPKVHDSGRFPFASSCRARGFRQTMNF